MAYASVSGSTREVADAIAAELRSEEVDVSVRPAVDITGIVGCSAVVLGSSIRAGRWLPDAVRFLETHRAELENLPVAYFTTCLTMVEDTKENRETVLSYLEPVLELAPNIQPIALGLFAGSLSPSFEPIVPGPGPYGDFRDWDKIKRWATKLRPALQSDEPATAAPVVLSESIMSFTDISGTDLSEADLHASDLQGAKLRKTKLRGADLRKSDLKKADLQGADLREANLSWADLSGCVLKGSDLRMANLMGSDLRGANLKKADLSGANLNGANLSGANLRKTDLESSDLNWAVLSGADLKRADLRRASLGWADLSNCKLGKAKLKAARYNEHTKWPPDFSADEAGCELVRGPY